MKSNFDACLAFTLRFEGGYVNDPHDPGGETNFGISKRAYPKEDIKAMTKERASAIYRRDYWDAVRGDDLPLGLDLVAFDAAVNSGVMRGAQWVQKAVLVDPDGRIGPVTIKAAGKLDQQALESVIKAAVHLRFNFLTRLKTWSRYRNGWTRRCEEVEATALKMAKRAKAPEPELPQFGGLGWIVKPILDALALIFARKK